MEFDWDAANTEHIARHDVTPLEVEQVVENGPLDIQQQVRHDEVRFLQLGSTDNGRVLAVVVIERAGKIRVVTARQANKKERAFYFQEVAQDGEPGGDS